MRVPVYQFNLHHGTRIPAPVSFANDGCVALKNIVVPILPPVAVDDVDHPATNGDHHDCRNARIHAAAQRTQLFRMTIHLPTIVELAQFV